MDVTLFHIQEENIPAIFLKNRKVYSADELSPLETTWLLQVCAKFYTYYHKWHH